MKQVQTGSGDRSARSKLGLWLALVLGAPATLGVVPACKQAADPACDAERERARAAVQAGEIATARSSLDAARAACPEKLSFDLDRIEAQIERHEARTSELAERERTREAARAPLSAFVTWVRRSRESDKRLPSEVCTPRGEPGFGYCRADTELAGGLKAEVHYLSSKPVEVYGYRVVVALPATCADLGENRVVRRWQLGGDELSYCELTGSGLKGLSVLVRVTHADGGGASSVVRVFSRAYVERDAELTATLGTSR